MYLVIPLTLILASTLGILYIVWRKLPHLKELAESKSSASIITIKNDWRNVVYDFCPEVVDRARDIKVEEYKDAWLVEMEKFLRRLRVASLKMDRFSGSLIKKIRRRTYSNGDPTYVEKEKVGNVGTKSDVRSQENDREELRKTEQGLISEIAKNPKSVAVYEKLGDLYSKMDDYQDAKESYEAAIELNPSDEALKKKHSQALEKLA